MADLKIPNTDIPNEDGHAHKSEECSEDHHTERWRAPYVQWQDRFLCESGLPDGKYDEVEDGDDVEDVFEGLMPAHSRCLTGEIVPILA
jgi:hypothetical protein